MALFGLVVAFVGLFPGVIGLDQSPGVGILQTMIILGGLATMIIGAYIFIYVTYYPGRKQTLAQQIATRLSMTGLVIAAASGLADVLGFGTHQPGVTAPRAYLGPVQALGVVGGFLIASLGVVIFALMGNSDDDSKS